MMAKQKTVLFIDDSPLDRKLISNLLSKNDFNVLLAEEGSTGFKMALEQMPDLILLDILLPKMSGIELCKKFKKNPDTQKIPVIFYTAMDTPKQLIDYASCGAQDLIPKTIPPAELVTVINNILNK